LCAAASSSKSRRTAFGAQPAMAEKHRRPQTRKVNSSHQAPTASLGRRNGVSRDRVTEIQRARLLTAASDALEALGYPRMSVAEIISRAGVSRKTFYDAFADVEDCFLTLLEETITRAATLAGDAYYGRRHWRAGIRSALGKLLVLMESEPALARLWMVETLKGGERVLERRAQALVRLAELIGEGRTATDAVCEPPGVIAVGVVGGVLEIVHARVVSSSEEPLTDLLGPLMYMIVLPYLGTRVAQSELNKPSPQVAPRESVSVSDGDPLDGLKMRLTYRTVQALVAIGQHPGASNRGVAEASGVVDQGQISKLLSRLARLELIENHGLGQEKGGANAWELTQRGKQVVRATQPRMNALV
jgi:AcrR family transcriptional regulator/DNA-binding MarR family transcriptional regulator